MYAFFLLQFKKRIGENDVTFDETFTKIRNHSITPSLVIILVILPYTDYLSNEPGKTSECKKTNNILSLK